MEIYDHNIITPFPSILHGLKKTKLIKMCNTLYTVGVYPSGADNKMYVDYYYVGGGQNPLSNATPKGSLTFKTYLPNGKYDYRYL